MPAPRPYIIIGGLICRISEYLLFTIYKHRTKRAFVSFSATIVKSSPKF
jgi:hypothetical protein